MADQKVSQFTQTYVPTSSDFQEVITGGNSRKIDIAAVLLSTLDTAAISTLVSATTSFYASVATVSGATILTVTQGSVPAVGDIVRGAQLAQSHTYIVSEVSGSTVTLCTTEGVTANATATCFSAGIGLITNGVLETGGVESSITIRQPTLINNANFGNVCTLQNKNPYGYCAIETFTNDGFSTGAFGSGAGQWGVPPFNNHYWETYSTRQTPCGFALLHDGVFNGSNNGLAQVSISGASIAIVGSVATITVATTAGLQPGMVIGNWTGVTATGVIPANEDSRINGVSIAVIKGSDTVTLGTSTGIYPGMLVRLAMDDIVNGSAPPLLPDGTLIVASLGSNQFQVSKKGNYTGATAKVSLSALYTISGTNFTSTTFQLNTATGITATTSGTGSFTATPAFVGNLRMISSTGSHDQGVTAGKISFMKNQPWSTYYDHGVLSSASPIVTGLSGTSWIAKGTSVIARAAGTSSGGTSIGTVSSITNGTTIVLSGNAGLTGTYTLVFLDQYGAHQGYNLRLSDTSIDIGTTLNGNDGYGNAAAVTFGTNGLITPKINSLAITTSTGTLTIANGKTLTSSNTLTFAGTDGSTLTIGTGGTLGTAAFTAASAYATLAGNNTFTGLNTFSNNGDLVTIWTDSASSTNAKIWQQYITNGSLIWFLINDDGTTRGDKIMQVDRIGSTAANIDFEYGASSGFVAFHNASTAKYGFLCRSNGSDECLGVNNITNPAYPLDVSGNMHSTGSLLLDTVQTTVSGSTSGNAKFSQPLSGSSLKIIEIYCAALLGTASYTFPIAFTNTPVVITTSGPAASVVTSLSTTAVTITGATTTGPIMIIGY